MLKLKIKISEKMKGKILFILVKLKPLKNVKYSLKIFCVKFGLRTMLKIYINIKKNINDSKFLFFDMSDETIRKKNKSFFGKKNKL